MTEVSRTDLAAAARRLHDNHPMDCAGCPDCSILIDRNMLSLFAAEIERLRGFNERSVAYATSLRERADRLAAALREIYAVTTSEPDAVEAATKASVIAHDALALEPAQ